MELNRKDTVDVLIVGAGPAGLMMACQLAMHNISFRIIDKKASTAFHSGALIVHARTLEILHQMGLAEKALKAGIIARSIRLQFNHKKRFTIDISDIDKSNTHFPYLLMLEQWHTENLLTQFLQELGHSVENNTAFVSFTQEGGVVASKILQPDGSVGDINSLFLIGADGSGSSIRTELNIPFPGKTQHSRLFITDCHAGFQSPTRDISFSFATDFTSGFFPLSGQRWRVDGHIPIIQQKEVQFEDVRNFFLGKPDFGMELHTPQWFSVFHSHSRCADLFRQNRCFLIGDAAHVHSPVGAQGMNTGLQDAHNLAWKLALAIRGKASENLLNTYENERRPLALSIIRSTDWTYSFMTNHFYLVRFLRVRVVPLILPLILYVIKNNPTILGRVFKTISGIGIKYRHYFLTETAANRFPYSAPKPGERLPHLSCEINGKQISFYDMMAASTFQLFIFGQPLPPAKFQTVIHQYAEVISVIHISKETATRQVYKSLGIKNEGCYLVRPDHFIAWRSQGFDANSLGNYLQKFLT